MFSSSYNRLVSLALIFMALALLGEIVSLSLVNISVWIISSTLTWEILALIFLWFSYRSSVVGFLLATFCILTVIRISGINDLLLVLIPSIIAFIFMSILFFYIAYQNTCRRDSILNKPIYIGQDISSYEWHLTFVRLYIGFDLIAHTSEKLFAGITPFLGDVHAFTSLGVPYPEFYVALAGLCEFGGAVAIGLGFLTRFGAIATFLYILIATILGHHFSIGYIWATPGGGWEFPVLWMILTLSFAVLGAGKFSVDASLKARYRLPRWLLRLMG